MKKKIVMTVALYIATGIMTGLIVFFNVTGFLDDDSLAEEVVEEVLDLALDIDVDLSDGCGDCDD